MTNSPENHHLEDSLKKITGNDQEKKVIAALKSENGLLKQQLTQASAAHEQALATKKASVAENQLLKEKLAEYENEKIFLLRTKKINAIVELMQVKGLLEATVEVRNEKIK